MSKELLAGVAIIQRRRRRFLLCCLLLICALPVLDALEASLLRNSSPLYDWDTGNHRHCIHLRYIGALVVQMSTMWKETLSDRTVNLAVRTQLSSLQTSARAFLIHL